MAAKSRIPLLVLAALAAAALAFAAPAGADLTQPVPLDPGNGASVEALPPFSWSAVAGADSYQFQVAADQNFNSPVGRQGEGSFTTKNTRATLKKTLPNGRYWWRVRATTRAGDASPWSTPRSIVKSWTQVPSSMSPYYGFPFTFPTSPMSLGWSPVPYAASYLFSLASDPNLANLVESTNGQPDRDVGDELRPRLQPPPVGHLLLGGHPSRRGEASSAHCSGVYRLRAVVADGDHDARVTDLNSTIRGSSIRSSPGTPVAGSGRVRGRGQPFGGLRSRLYACAARSRSPARRRRPIPATVAQQHVLLARAGGRREVGNAGELERRPDFVKTFDKVPPVTPPSIKNLHMRDNLVDPGTDVDPGTAGYQTNVPVLKWDSVPGASAYLVDVAQYNASLCNWGGDGKLARHDLDSVVDAARRRLEQHQAVPGRDAGRQREHAPRPEQAVLRPRAREGRARRRAAGRLRRFHVSRRRHRCSLPVGRLSHGRRLHAVLQHRLPRLRRLPAPGHGDAHPADPAHHVEAARRQAELFRARLEGRELQQHRRLRLHARPGVLAAQPDQGRRPTATRRRSSTGPSCPQQVSTAAEPSATRSWPLPPTSRSSRSRPRSCRRTMVRLPRRSPSSAGRRSRERGDTGSRSPRSRRSPRRSRTSRPPRPRTRHSPPIPPTRLSTGASARTTRT